MELRLLHYFIQKVFRLFKLLCLNCPPDRRNLSEKIVWESHKNLICNGIRFIMLPVQTQGNRQVFNPYI